MTSSEAFNFIYEGIFDTSIPANISLKYFMVLAVGLSCVIHVQYCD